MKSNFKVWLIIILILLILICIFKSCYNYLFEDFSSSKLYNYNLLHNSLFENGKNISEFYKNKGKNSIIKYENNPVCDSSSFVLQQMSDKFSAYILKVSLQNNSYYKLTLWVSFKETNLVNNLLSVKLFENETDDCKNDFEVKEQIVDKKNVKNTIWYKYEYIFNLNNVSSVNSDILLYIGCNTNMEGTRYITNINLIPYLYMSPTFDATIGLQSYLDGLNKNSCNESLFWNDLSNTDSKFKWSIKPQWNTEGYYTTINNILTGPSMNSLDINYKNDVEFSIILYSKNIVSSDTTDGYYNVIHIDGNQDISLQLFLPKKNGTIKMILGGLNYETKNTINSNIKTIYTIIHKNSEIQIWLNDEKFDVFTKIPKLHFEENKIIFNQNKDWNAQLFAILIYNKDLSDEEIKYINNFLIYHPKNVLPIIVPPIPIMSINKLSPSNKKKIDPLCPTVLLDSNNYLITIPKDSKYVKKLGYGVRNYGSNKKVAHDIYKSNFPDCHMPKLLNFDPVNNCPYIIEKNNPCAETDCLNIDWTDEHNMNKKCMRNISHYCYLNKDIDPKCFCWKEENHNNDECMKHRKKYEPPEDYGYTINVFDITEHQDFKNYIRKDKIPCWNCNLSAPTGKDTVIRNWSQ